MKKVLAVALISVLAGATVAQAGVNVNVNLGVPVAAPLPPPALAGSYPPVPPAATAPPQLVLDQAPQFIYLPALGFYMSVDVPYDIAYVDGGYYLYSGGYWYFSRVYWGPWSIVPLRRLPAGLRRYRYQQIRELREHEYQEYVHDRGHYRGNWHRPVALREERRHERAEERREERRHDRWDDRR